MFFALIRNVDGNDVAGLYANDEELREDVDLAAYPEAIPDTFLEFHVSGRDYHAKQESLRNLAIDLQIALSDAPCLYMSEMAWISAWFTTQGKKYGLLREFRENGII